MKFVYPHGKAKALTFSYDDGQVQDKRLAEIFNRYGMKGTFHLNSGNLGANKDEDIYVRPEEVEKVYRGHEIACHGVHHRNPSIVSLQETAAEIAEDRRSLEKLTGTLVQGMSYPFGNYSGEVKQAARVLGIKYSRTVRDTYQFFPPADFLEWHPTCHHGQRLEELGERFLSVPGYYELPLMYVWGHSYEFARENNWELIESFARAMSGRDDIWYATNLEICNYLQAVRSLEYSADGRRIHNPMALSVWLTMEEGLAELPPGGTCDCGEPAADR